MTDLLLFPQYAVTLNSELHESLIVSKSIIEIFNLAVDLPKDKFNIIASIFHYHKEKFTGVKPGLQQCESISEILLVLTTTKVSSICPLDMLLVI